MREVIHKTIHKVTIELMGYDDKRLTTATSENVGMISMISMISLSSRIQRFLAASFTSSTWCRYTSFMSGFLLQTPVEDGSSGFLRPFLLAAVVMRRERINNRWQPWRWSLVDVVPHESGFGEKPRLLYQDDQQERWLHPNFKVELLTTDAEGYYLNVSTSAPCFWVLWRMEETLLAEEPIPIPHIVTLSYHDAGRWLDAQETVEQVPVAMDVAEWLQAFVDQHHVLELKRRKRPESFRPLHDRFGNPAIVTTEKKFGGTGHG